LSDIRADACIVAKTALEVAENLEKGAPSVTILTKNNITFWTNNVEIAFSLADDKDQNISYNIVVDGSLSQQGTAQKEKTMTQRIIIRDGQHSVYISAFDSDGNSGTSQAITLNVNSSLNYTIDVISPVLNQTLNETKADISFMILHSTANNVSYSLFIDDVEKDSGIVDIGMQKDIKIINLSPGIHELMISSKDAEGREAYSEKRGFEVRVAG